MRIKRIIICLSVCLTLAALVLAVYFTPIGEIFGIDPEPSAANPPAAAAEPDEALTAYMQAVADRNYEGMYALLSAQSQAAYPKDDFIMRNKRIYEGIEASGISTEILNAAEQADGSTSVYFSCHMDTMAGEISFLNEAMFIKDEKNRSLLEWTPALIFPALTPEDKVRVSTIAAERGSIYDRNNVLLAGKGVASSIGLVPGKMRGGSLWTPPAGTAAPSETPLSTDTPKATDSGLETALPDAGTNTDETAAREADIAQIAELLHMSVESIQKKLGASYVKEDTFVPLKLVAKENYELKELLLTIPGIKIVDAPVRSYPLGEKASHLIGYIQSISAEELNELQDESYGPNSVIGKAGLEKIYEERLRAVDGQEIAIVDGSGAKKTTLAILEPKNGEDIYLTIDAQLQSDLYDQFAQDKSCSVAMNPKTGEVLALVSTPSYNANDFTLGMPKDQWTALNEDANKPLWNRFKAALCPGSVFKAVTAAIGLNTGAVSADYDFGPSGLEWKKDGSWGGYYVKTTEEYEGPADAVNALTYSDNIYFAKAALTIGPEVFARELINIGFEEQIPFEYGLCSSTISSAKTFTSEIQLADSGYGQGQLLMNPVHLASIYAAFVGNGSIPKPYLLYKNSPSVEYWKENAFSKETAATVLEGLVSVIKRGTGTDASMQGIALAGKTGTAEIKQSKEDNTGTELGWFVLMSADADIMTADADFYDPLLVLSMAEDVKNRGGSHYVLPKVKAVFEKRWGGAQ